MSSAMTKKVHAFQNVSEAVTLDSKGYHEVAFTKYLKCLHMLSSLLANECSSTAVTEMDDNRRNDIKQILSVICDCAERAGSIVISNDDVKNPACSSAENIANQRHTSHLTKLPSQPLSSCRGDNSDSCLLQGTPSLTYAKAVSSRNKSRYPVFTKVDEENSALFRKYQVRINNARDKYTKENLQLELQRRLAENLVIAKMKREEAMRKQKEEKEKALDLALKGMMLSGPCLNAVEQEKREIYLEVLHFEASQPLELGLVESSSPHEIIQKIFENTLRCSNHPLFQWLTMVQTKLKRSFSVLLKEYSEYTSSLPGICSVRSVESSGSASGARYSCTLSQNQNQKLEQLQKSLEAMSVTIRESTDIIMEVIFAVYKSQLPAEADTAFYKAVECSLVSPLWPMFLTLTRISNLSSEWKVFETILNCQENSHDFDIPSLHPECKKAYIRSSEHLKRIPSLLSLVDKLSVLVYILRNVSADAAKQNVPERTLGADQLVPILCYVVVQSGMPQLYSECWALRLLVDSKYMLGEEGYSLTSFQTALNYLEVKDVINPYCERSIDSSNEVSETNENQVQ